MILAVVIEIAVILALFTWFKGLAAWVEIILRIISFVIVIFIINNSNHLSSDLMWILLIILFPAVGAFVYLLLGADLFGSRSFRNIRAKTADHRRQVHP